VIVINLVQEDFLGVIEGIIAEVADNRRRRRADNSCSKKRRDK